MATPKEIHLKLLTDISDDMIEGSPEYTSFIEHMKAYVPRGVLGRKGRLLDKLDSMATRGHLGIGNYKALEKVAELSSNNDVKDMIKETKQNLQALEQKEATELYIKLRALSDGSDDSAFSEASVKSAIPRAVSDVPTSVYSASPVSESTLGTPSREFRIYHNLPWTKSVPSTSYTNPTKRKVDESYESNESDESDESDDPITARYKHRVDQITHKYAKEKIVRLIKEIKMLRESMKTAVGDNKLDTMEKGMDESVKTELNKACTLFGRISSTVKQMCDIICDNIKATSKEIKLVWPGYKPINVEQEEVITFVAVTENEDRGYRQVLGFDVLFCRENTCNEEGLIVTNSQQMKEKPFTKRELKQLQQCLTKYSPKLMSLHSNIEIMTACSVKSTDFIVNDGDPKLSNETCIVLYVHVKGIVPLQEEVFPKEIWGFPVDVREGCFMFCGGPNDYHDTLKMGCAIGRDPQHGNGKSGTLGAFIEHEGENYCLTSAHVLLSDNEMVEVEHSGGRKTYDSYFIGIHQPSRNPPQAEDRFGELFEVIYETGGENSTGMEIAVVKIQHRDPVSGSFPDGTSEHAGFNAWQPMVFNSGEIIPSSSFVNNQGTMASEVVKYGCTSLVTRGSFALVGTSVRKTEFSFPVGGFKVELHGQIEVNQIGDTKFAEHGDSGALVFGFFENNRAYLRPVGMVTGLTTYGSAIITPISDILEKLGVNHLKCFQSSNPEPMSGINAESTNQHSDTMRNIKTELEKLNKDIEQMDTQQKKMDEKMDTQQKQMDEKMDTQQRKLDEKLEKMMSQNNKVEEMLTQVVSMLNTKQ